MTELEQHLLAIIQDAFPLEERPYRRLAEMLNTQEQAVFDAVENLRQSGIIRRIGGIYDSHRLGFISRLCAGKVTDLEKFASAVNAIPAITHNYVRSHEYNVWFTVIAESEDEIRKVVDGLCASTDLPDVHILSATKKFKINTVMGGAGAPVDSGVILSGGRSPKSKDPDPHLSPWSAKAQWGLKPSKTVAIKRCGLFLIFMQKQFLSVRKRGNACLRKN